MAECPFCGSGVTEDLITYGGTCPKCFAEIPGEEAATDPGEEVRAIQERTDRRRATLRAAVGLFAMLCVVSCTGMTAVVFVLWPEPQVIEIVDFDTLDFPMPEVVLGPHGEAVAAAEAREALEGGVAVAGSSGAGSSGAGSRGVGGTGDGGTGVGGTGVGGTGVGGTPGGDRAGSTASSGGGIGGVASASSGGRGSEGSSGGSRGAGTPGGTDDAVAMAERFAPAGGPSGTGVGDLGGEAGQRGVTGLGPRGTAGTLEGPKSLEAPKATSRAGITGLGIEAKVDREMTMVYKDRDGIIMMIGERMVQQIPMLNQCYERQLKVNPSLEGRWRLDFTVATSGAVKSASATGLNRRDKELESCIVDRMESEWRFARIVDEYPVRRTLTFRPR